MKTVLTKNKLRKRRIAELSQHTKPMARAKKEAPTLPCELTVIIGLIIGAFCFMVDPEKAEYVWATIEKVLIAILAFDAGKLRS